MEVNHLVDLLSELTPNSECKYVRSDEKCVFVKIDTNAIRLYTKTPEGKDFEFAPTFIQSLADGIKENQPFSTSQLLNNKGSNRAVIDSIIAHTSEFYWMQDGRSRYTIWIPSKPHKPGELIEWTDMDMLNYLPTSNNMANAQVEPTTDEPSLISQDYQYMAAIKTKPFLILGGFSGTGKSIAVKSLAFTTCPCDGYLNTSETSPGNYLLLSVKPNWHDATDITGFRSSVNRNYYVTDFMRFVVKAKMYEDKNVPFFVCLDEMNLAPVEEYFADFLSVIESRTKKSDGSIVTDALIPASVFNDAEYADDFNIFLSLGIHPTEPIKDITEFNARIKESQEDAFYEEQWLVDELKQIGMTIPQNLVVIGTVNMDDTTNSFSRKVIDRAMTFETVVGKFSVDDYFGDGTQLLMEYCKHPAKGSLYLSDEVRATDLPGSYLKEDEKKQIIDFINNINEDLSGTPFQISYRVLNETILLYRSKKEIDRILGGEYELEVEFSLNLNDVFDDILMQKILPRIEGDYDKCHVAIANLYRRAVDTDWKRSAKKLEFMEKRFGSDKSGFTSFWN